jgi:hypothetical protein
MGDGDRTYKVSDGAGGEPYEWPADLRVREFPAEWDPREVAIFGSAAEGE